MKYIYGALLLHEAKLDINEENLTKVLSSVDANVDSARVKALIETLKGVNIEDVLKNASAMQVAAPAAQATTTSAPKVEAKKEEKKPEEESKAEEDAAAGLAALFG